MRNEEAVRYEAGAATTTQDNVTTLTDARVKLVGITQPTVTINGARDLENYCRSLLQDSAVEEFHVLCVNARLQVLADSCINRGTLSEVQAYPRSVATVALLSNAHAVFLTHNHPGGTCSPSMDDIRSTTTIKNALKMFDIYVLDHMIVTPSGDCYSMTQHGDITLR